VSEKYGYLPVMASMLGNSYDVLSVNEDGMVGIASPEDLATLVGALSVRRRQRSAASERPEVASKPDSAPLSAVTKDALTSCKLPLWGSHPSPLVSAS